MIPTEEIVLKSFTRCNNILGKSYIVMGKSDNDMHSNLGNALTKHQIIDLNIEQHQNQFDESFLHEVIHVVSNELSLDLPEETVRRLAVGLYSAGFTHPEINYIELVKKSICGQKGD